MSVDPARVQSLYQTTLKPRLAGLEGHRTIVKGYIIKGIACIGGKKCSKIAPATAEKAKPAKPDTTPPAKTAIPRATYSIALHLNVGRCLPFELPIRTR